MECIFYYSLATPVFYVKIELQSNKFKEKIAANLKKKAFTLRV